MPIEHIVILDALDDPNATWLCEQRDVKALVLPKVGTELEGLAAGLSHAQGVYVAFWFDDITYLPGALQQLWGVASGYDVGCFIGSRFLIDGPRTQRPISGAADSPGYWHPACISIRREFALKEPLEQYPSFWDWYQALRKHHPTWQMSFEPLCWIA